ncbi:MAG TPA: ferritin-like domain-containing protein [Conexibacter sp.]|nr:ferritin-like domain-containing protein [Conexibacter sp.]
MPRDIHPTFDELDRDGALREAGARVDPITRASFLRRAGAILGGGAAAAIVLPNLSGLAGGGPAVAAAASSGTTDVDILNYALTLEYLEAAFYAEALKKGALRGELQQFAKVVANHERQHVQALQGALGSKAVKRPSFDFKGTTSSPGTFASTAQTLEDTGVEAYQGQATNISSRRVLAAAISIHPVEARHAAWVASIMSKGGTSPASPAPDAFNPAADMQQVLAAVQGTGFVSTMSGAQAGGAVGGQPAMTG